MKKIKSTNMLTALLLCLASLIVQAQEPANPGKEIYFTVESTFTGTVENEFDSVFNTYLVLDTNYLRDIKSINVIGKGKSVSFDIDGSPVQTLDGKAYFPINGIIAVIPGFAVVPESKSGAIYMAKPKKLKSRPVMNN